MSVVKRVREVLAGTESDGMDAEAGKSGDDGPSSSEDERTTNLYACDSCGTTYVSTEMESCSQCQTPVERVPTEQDLGLL